MYALFVITPPGLEAVCADELRGLGITDSRPTVGGVSCSGDLADLLRLQLASRIASRVLLRLWEGPLPELRRGVGAVDWGAWLQQGGSFRVEVSGGGNHPAQLSRPVEEAIARQVKGARAAAKGTPGQQVAVRLADGRVSLSLDASGEHLHLRGYRQETGAAPLRENLAAGILSLAGWNGEQPLLDPMCGSGTFLIEGALQALRRAPGLERSFACESWPCLEPALLAQVRESLRARELEAPVAQIHGSDRNAGALGLARRNARRAGVLEHLHLTRADATLVEPATGPGVLVANLPYGRRVGEERELADLYRRFGRRLRERFGGWTAALLVADTRLGEQLALPAPQKHALRNGGLPCHLLVARL